MAKPTTVTTLCLLAALASGGSALARQAPEPGPNKMVHCPNVVEGAKTTIKNSKEGVVITVTAKDEAAVQEIRKRAAHLAEAAKKPGGGQHTGEGDFGGSRGHCPVVMKDTTITVSEVKGGAKLTVKADKPDDVKTLQTAVKDRQAALAKSPPPAHTGTPSPAGTPDKSKDGKKPGASAPSPGGTGTHGW
jgi:TusA-related sulfurtransferase